LSIALVNPDILKWGRNRAGYPVNVVAKKLKVKDEKVENWENGFTKPTFTQAQNIAKLLRIPFGYLYLETPPDETQLLPDLRTIGDISNAEFSLDLKETIETVLYKQSWYRDYRIELGFETLNFIGKYSESNEVSAIAKDITTTLDISIEDRYESENWEKFFNCILEKAEASGIWIMQNSIVNNNTHRSLNLYEFRGFTICDKIAPLIFINSADSKAAQIFTLIHEIAHLWLGESGVDNINFRMDGAKNRNALELKCNDIAAEVLVPKLLIKSKWNNLHTDIENIYNLHRFFKVSELVIARRALELNLINKNSFFEFYDGHILKWNEIKKNQKTKSGGPGLEVLLPMRNGRSFTNAILQSVYSQSLLFRDGANLLGVSFASLDKYAQTAGARW